MSILQQLQEIILAADNSVELDSVTSIYIAINTLDDLMSSSDPKVFVQNIDKLISTMEQMINDVVNVEVSQKTMLLDFIVLVVRTYPKTLKIKKHRISKIYKICFDLLKLIATEVTSQWMDPPNGYSAEDGQDEENNYSKAVMANVDQLSYAIGFSQTVLHIQPIFLEYIQRTDDWRYPYAALMAASQIAIQKANAQQLGLFAQWAFKETEHSHPKVRFAALQMIGQYGDDLNPDFQDLYYEPFVQATTRTLKDPIPRVVAHTFACATNFFDQYKDVWKIENCLSQYLGPIVHSIKTGSSWLKQNAISILASFGETQDAFGPNLPNIFDLGFQVIKNFSGQPEFKQVINQSFELLSMLLCYQKKQLVQTYLHQIVALLFNQRTWIGQDYFLQSWRRICQENEDFTDLTLIYDYILEAAENLQGQHGDDDCAEGFEAVTATFKSFKVKAAPFAEKTLIRAREIYEDKDRSLKLREVCLQVMAATVVQTQALSADQFATWKQMAESIYSYLCQKFQESLDNDEMIEELPCICAVIQQITEALAPLLDGANLLKLTQKQLTFARRLQQSYETNSQYKCEAESNNANNEYQPVMTLVEENISALEHAMDTIPDILREHMKVCPEPTVKFTIIKTIQSQVERAVGKGNYITLYALNLSVSIVQNLTYAEYSPICNQLYEMYFHFAKHPNSRIRNGGIYGINLILTKTPKGIFGANEISTVLQTLSNAYTEPFEDDEKFFNHHCKDNVISALGKLLKYYSSDFPQLLNQSVFGYWFNSLPLNTDKIEGNDQQEFLIQLLQSNPSAVIKQVQDLTQLCQAFAKFLMKREDKEYNEIREKTKKCLLHVKEWTLFKESTDYLWNSLSNSHKRVLTQLMQN